MPASIGGIVSRLSLYALIEHGSEYHANRMTTWIAPRVSERADLLEVDSAETGFFEEFSSGGSLERLILVHEAARKSP
jgi:hypothetical protein